MTSPTQNEEVLADVESPPEAMELQPTEKMVFGIDPKIASQLVFITQKEVQDDPELAPHIALLYVIKGYFHGIMADAKVTIPSEAYFTYYINLYQAVVRSLGNLPATNEAVIVDGYRTEAALQLFQVYLASPNESLNRKMVIHAAEALRKIVAARQEHVSDQATPVMLQQLMHLTMMSEFVKRATKGRDRRHNLTFITWLHDLFIILLQDPNHLSGMLNHPQFKSVAEQITARIRRIKISE